MIEIPGRIPIRIHPIFWLLVILLSWINSLTVTGTILWSIVIIVSLLVHEYGHALTALFFGQSARIDLMGLGGLTSRAGPQLKKWQDFLIVLNGPVCGFLLCVVAYFIREHFPSARNSPWEYILNITVYVNLVWTILNLVPVQPLDGGKLLGIILEGIFGVKGLRMSYFISMLLAGALGAFFLSLQALIAGVLFFLFAFESYRGWHSLSKMTDVDRQADLQQSLQTGQELLNSGRHGEALNLYQDIMQKTGHGLIYQTALENSADIYMQDERYPQAYLLLAPQKKNLTPEGLELFHNVAYHTGHWDDVIQTGNEVYQLQPNATTALINAVAYAHKGQAKPAIGWLKNAIDQGLENVQQVLSRPDFDPIRKDPAFQVLSKNYT